MKDIFLVLLIMVVIATPSLCVTVVPHADSSFNVVSYGAKGDGQTDDSQAFEKAWQNVCGATQDTTTLLIPEGKTFLLQPMLFKGPCKSGTINIEFQGTIVAPKTQGAWKWGGLNKGAWVKFSGISNLVIQGGGKIDGEGASWWQTYPEITPNALQFHQCKNLRLSNLTHINSPKIHISIYSCNDFSIANIHIIAPEKSQSTDGIDITRSSNILVENSNIETGGDCIAINNGSTFINITGVTCGPGHGISVGSLGKNNTYETAEEIYVHNCTFIGTQNGARIKTWRGGSGYARKITFEDIILVGAKNPIIIDEQFYAIGHNDIHTGVQVSDVTYDNVRGTTDSNNAISLTCDDKVGCTNLVFNNINITTMSGSEPFVECYMAHGKCSSSFPNVTCLSA
ncbi:probable polygalacturonase At3g15720 [Lotus japonicus]|uniref:probable polygalacturonase At3g15720 n=1 Tax=Lotus japonicus TaxID=34305 RepID=UPI002590B657|nr:probable polygalacturonase At3g15720 [Lotus japonicus]